MIVLTHVSFILFFFSFIPSLVQGRSLVCLVCYYKLVFNGKGEDFLYSGWEQWGFFMGWTKGFWWKSELAEMWDPYTIVGMKLRVADRAKRWLLSYISRFVRKFLIYLSNVNTKTHGKLRNHPVSMKCMFSSIICLHRF